MRVTPSDKGDSSNEVDYSDEGDSSNPRRLIHSDCGGINMIA